MSRHSTSVDPSDDDESTLGGRKSDGDESAIISRPLSDVPSLLIVDPLPDDESTLSEESQTVTSYYYQ